MSGTARLDLHVHSRYSVDSRLSVEQAAERAAYEGLRGFALTDHNTVAGHRALQRLKGLYRDSLFVPGVEVSTREGHLLVYGVEELPPVGRPLAEVLDWVRAHSAVAVLAHPLRWIHGVGARRAEAAAVPAVESRNGRNSELANVRAELLAARRRLGSTGGSDAHELSNVGRAFTEFPEPVENVEDLLELLRRGRTAGRGTSLAFGGRLGLVLRNGMLRAQRGFRPV